MFISPLVQGKGSATFSKEEANDAAELISRGVGFSRIVDTLGAREIVLREPAVRFYLSTYYPFHRYIDALLLKIHEAPRNTHIGDWFEYLVAAALMKNLVSADQRPGMCSNYNIVEYLDKGSENTFLKPDDMCGPDLLYKREKDLHIVQVRCVKYFYRAYRLNSEKTVDPNLFYTVKNPKSERLGKVLKQSARSWTRFCNANSSTFIGGSLHRRVLRLLSRQQPRTFLVRARLNGLVAIRHLTRTFSNAWGRMTRIMFGESWMSSVTKPPSLRNQTPMIRMTSLIRRTSKIQAIPTIKTPLLCSDKMLITSFNKESSN
jgi:hypothetical protein